MFDHLLDKYKNGLDEIKNDEKALKEELARTRFMYNIWHCFSCGFVLSFFGGGFIGYIFNMKMLNHPYINFFCIIGIFVVILLVQWIIAYVASVCYERMKIVKDELKKIK